MENTLYAKLRESYRDLIQIVLTQCLDIQSKNRIEVVYKKKNIRKSIDSELRMYCFTKSSTMCLSDDYWREYELSEVVSECEQVKKALFDFESTCDAYFALDKNDERQQYDMIMNMIHKMQSNNQTFDSNDSPFVFPEFIVKLAQELSSEIEVPKEFSDVSDPKQIFEKMMDKNMQRVLMDMMTKVSEKIKTKIDSGDICPDEIQTQAQDCLKTFVEKNPEMNEMLSKMMSGMSGQNMNMNNRGGDARERMRRKLKKKNKNVA